MLLLIYNHIFPKLEIFLTGLKPFFLFLLSQIIPLLLLFILNTGPIACICGIEMGIGLGLFLSHVYQLFPDSPKNYKEFVIRGAIGVLGTFTCYALTLLLPQSTSKIHLFFQFSFLGLWLGLGNHFISHFFFQQKESSNA